MTQRGVRRAEGTFSAGLKRVLDSMTGSPAFIHAGRLVILDVDDLGRALYAPPLFTAPARPVNIGRFEFLDLTSRIFFPG
ncbi:hypothetical protein [Streptomyces sp. VRA16 Mangrove soil]|uniref:MmyB family transcriptional regulator n=1 Tax=Streptomyces sp. VRA16 Mangrove soil TaxID=2817434 RepID=UPI0022770A5C|nr:hypothetical protein [Streptomyces sp. VRA16 Mangrove soil]